jgi:hypothetical protein
METIFHTVRNKMSEEKMMTTALEQLSDDEFKVTFDRPEGVSHVVDAP